MSAVVFLVGGTAHLRSWATLSLWEARLPLWEARLPHRADSLLLLEGPSSLLRLCVLQAGERQLREEGLLPEGELPEPEGLPHAYEGASVPLECSYGRGKEGSRLKCPQPSRQGWAKARCPVWVTGAIFAACQVCSHWIPGSIQALSHGTWVSPMRQAGGPSQSWLWGSWQA